MSLKKQHIGRRVAGVGVGVAMLMLGLEAPASAAVTIGTITPASGPDNLATAGKICRKLIKLTSIKMMSSLLDSLKSRMSVFSTSACRGPDQIHQVQLCREDDLLKPTAATCGVTRHLGLKVRVQA